MSDPQGNRISELIDAVRRPLEFASRNGFANILAIKGLESHITRICGIASANDPPDCIAEKFRELNAAFKGFDAMALSEKRLRVENALSIVGSICLNPSPLAEKSVPENDGKNLKLLKSPLLNIAGIGQRLFERLEKKGLSTVEDALYFLPIRYEDRRNLKDIKHLTPGADGLLLVRVIATGEVRYGGRKVFEVIAGDETGIVKLKWFNYRISYMKDRFKVNASLKAFGPVTLFNGQKEMVHPDIEEFDESDLSGVEGYKGIVPVYSQIDNMRQRTIRRMIRGIVEKYAGHFVCGSPEATRRELNIMDAGTAFLNIHIPDSLAAIERAKRALSFDELFVLELGLAIKKARIKAGHGPCFDLSRAKRTGLADRLKKVLPFSLTAAQERVLKEIKADFASRHPMMRLVQGDVGSGKTIVSLIASLWAIEAGFQVAVMAPTEILAEQHYLLIHGYAEKLGLKAVLLTGGLARGERQRALDEIRTGGVDIAIGTHALIQKDVEFNRNALAIIDEQHRFGVEQRAELKKKGADFIPHMLIMTATPIPRTLSMTVYGDLDVSIIDELPPGRTPVRTFAFKERERERDRAYGTIAKEVASGAQAYIVYPLVEESEEISLKDATRAKEHLQKGVFSDFAIGLLHGRLKPLEKEEVMRDFKARKTQILVCTTVVEVGIDVPNATVMLIEHADRFGLSQLHQLRGRVGRGERPSCCFLMAPWKASDDAFRRLKVMQETEDGFKIAEEDLKIRGPGDFIGTRQAGLPDFRSMGAMTDYALLKDARQAAFNYLEANPGLNGDGPASIKEVLRHRWHGRLELAEIG
ncbi:MAG: ATP-dependent DNA helicase RecG [Deltaproteobacteria bacterium]